MSEAARDLKYNFSPTFTGWEHLDESAARYLQGDLQTYFGDKAFAADGLTRLAEGGHLGILLDKYFLGNGLTVHDQIERDRLESEAPPRGRLLNSQGEMVINGVAKAAELSEYTGLPKENRRIVGLVLGGTAPGGYLRHHRRNGAAGTFRSDALGRYFTSGAGVGRARTAIVGGGAAGILAARFLQEVGFWDVTVFDQRGTYTGIWGQDNVREGSKNNPLSIHYDAISTDSARVVRPERSGREIERFLSELVAHHSFAAPLDPPIKAKVTGIEPGDLAHRVHFQHRGESRTEEFPIVIYAPGVGAPLPPSHEDHMTTRMKLGEVGERWQRQLSREELAALAGKRVVLVGLGNSTAEMVYQFQHYTDETGSPIDYQIITHYPSEAVHNPTRNFGESRVRVYRNVALPELSHLAGDLKHIDDLYQRALEEGRITSDAVEWNHERNVMTVTDRRGMTTAIPFDKLYTLIGYGQKPTVNEAMGLTTLDTYTGSIHHDWDGEVQKEPGIPGRDRLYPGYFALGPILRSSLNPNALVIPGIQWQLQEMFPTLVVRAAEWAVRSGYSPYLRRPSRG
jgi:hypothetical protein